MVVEILRNFKQMAYAFENEAHQILSKHKGSQSRVVLLDQTRKQLKMLSLQQSELFEQALDCTERGIFRAAHVMAWAGFMDFFEQKLSSDGLSRVKLVRS